MDILTDLLVRSIKYGNIPDKNIKLLKELYQNDSKKYFRLSRFETFLSPILSSGEIKSDIIYDEGKESKKYNLFEHGIVIRLSKPTTCAYRIFYVDKEELEQELPITKKFGIKKQKVFVLSLSNFQLFRPHHGEIKCQKKGCKNGAYFELPKKGYFCGVHSKKGQRKELKKFTPKEKLVMNEIRDNEWKHEYECVRNYNIKHEREGDIKLYRIKGKASSVEHIAGYISIFPNFKHQNRKDGIGMSSLSPMKLGPVPVNESKNHPHGKEESKNLENFHQGNKVYEDEGDTFYDQRIKMYSDDIPHRRKYSSGITKYSIWINKNGEEKKFSYIESRQFYCNFYERLARKENDFYRLKKLIRDGYNIMICGYDAHNITDIERDYLDESVSFGHERVLYVMLKYKEKDWPWKKYKTEDF